MTQPQLGGGDGGAVNDNFRGSASSNESDVEHGEDALLSSADKPLPGRI